MKSVNETADSLFFCVQVFVKLFKDYISFKLAMQYQSFRVILSIFFIFNCHLFFIFVFPKGIIPLLIEIHLFLLYFSVEVITMDAILVNL